MNWSEEKNIRSDMAKVDKRHNLPNPAKKPSEKDSLNVVRCVGCRRLITEHEIRKVGGCPRCGGAKVCGAYPSSLEWLVIQFWHFTRNWRVRGFDA